MSRPPKSNLPLPTLDIGVDPDEALDLDKGYVQRYWCARLQATPAQLMMASHKVGSTPRALLDYFEQLRLRRLHAHE